MSNDLLIDLRTSAQLDTLGSKARNLRCLLDNKFAIPRTFVVPWTAYQAYQCGDLSLIESMRQALAEQLDPQARYAVRSSATLEDGPCHSFAGQFKSVLNVTGIDPIFTAIWSIWATADSAGVNQYAARKAQPSDALKMAVIIQEMVTPVYSGVVFSRNPMTGTSETVVEAVSGLGTALVQEGKTPDRWVRHHNTWIALPEESSIPIHVIESAIEGSRRISKKLARDVDMEWVYNGSEIIWVQMREITALGSVKVYSNRLSREMMPGIIKPLIWSINVPLINAVWIKLMEEMVGYTGLKPEDLAKSFYYRSYFNMGAIGQIFNLAGFPSEGLEMMMGVIPQQEGRPVTRPTMRSIRLLPRLVAFLIDKWRFQDKVKASLPGLDSAIRAIPREPDPSLDAGELVAQIDSLYGLVQRVVQFNVVVPLLVSMYASLLSRDLKKLGIDPATFDLAEGMTELDTFQPSASLKELHRQSLALPPAACEVLRSGRYADLQALAGIAPFQQSVAQFLDRFGHFSDNSNDFSVAPWRESPEVIMRLVTSYTVKADPHQRARFSDLHAKGLARARMRLLYRRARTLIRYREEVSSLYVYAYGLFRPYFLALARQFVASGWLQADDDIFYLRWDEIRAAALAGDGQALREMACSRRAEIERVRQIELPEVIYGDEAPPVLPSVAHRMSGTPTSRGYYSGPARVVRGIEDFHKLNDGDVLVIPYSDVGWTPLFSRAGAVIAESGGMLSHSSIIAREYGIPAVVSVANASQLKDGQPVNVDGFRGIVTLLDLEAQPNN